MKSWRHLTGVLALQFFALVGWSQLPAARLDYLYPPSGQRGAATEVTITGKDLEGVSWIRFSHSDIKAVPRKDEDGDVVPNEFVVTIGSNAPLGMHKAWVGGGRFGVSNYRTFVVGELPELNAGSDNHRMEDALPITVGTTVFGQAAAAKYAWFKFPARKGQRILIECRPDFLDTKNRPSLTLFSPGMQEVENERLSGLIDYVIPADGEWHLRFSDLLFKGGVDYPYRLTVSTRPRIDLVYPPVGREGSSVAFTIFGRNLPGGQPAGWSTRQGKVLEKKVVHLKLPAGAGRGKLPFAKHLDMRRGILDHLEFRERSAAGFSNASYLGFTTEPIVYEAPVSAGDKGQTQTIRYPCAFIGKFFPYSDKDRVRFSARKGDDLAIEVFSERLGRPSNVFLLVEQLLSAKDGGEEWREVGQSLETASTLSGQFFNVRTRDPSQVFEVSTRDPSLRLKVPEDGDYRILLYDTFNTSKSDPLNVYCLSVRRAQPDFWLTSYNLASPKTIDAKWSVYVKSPTLRKGEVFPIKVRAIRRDGFTGPIDLTLSGLPPGTMVFPKQIPADQDAVTLIIEPSLKLNDWNGRFSITGQANIQGRTVRRHARHADISWSSYRNSFELPIVRAHIVEATPLAVVGRETAPVKVLFDDAKLITQANTALQAVEKARQNAQREVEQARQKLKAAATAGLTSHKTAARLAHKKAELKLARKSTESVAAKAALEQSKKRNSETSREPYIFETSVAGIVKLPIKLKSTENFKGPAKVRIYGHPAFVFKLKEITIDPKKKNEGTLELDLTKAQLPKGEFPLFFSIETPGKYQPYTAQDASRAESTRAQTDQKMKTAEQAAAKAMQNLEGKKMALDMAKEAKNKTLLTLASKEFEAAASSHQQADAKSKRLAAKQKHAAAIAKKINDTLKTPRTVNAKLFTTPFLLRVRKAPIQLQVQASHGKAGEPLALDIDLERRFEFADAVSLKLLLPTQATGITAQPATVNKAEYSTSLTCRTYATETAPGDYHCRLEATLNYNNQSITITEQVVLKISPAQEATASDTSTR